MENGNKKIAFGIPFKASEYTTALELCLHSIQKFVDCEYDVFLQIDITNEKLSERFLKKQIQEMFPYIKTCYYKRKRTGDYTQALVDWVMSESDADYMIFLHSDIFFNSDTAFENLLLPFKQDSSIAISGWEVPFSKYQSTYHINDNVKKSFYIAPRLCTWLYAINATAYRELQCSKNSLWLGNFHVFNLQNEPFPKDIEQKQFIKWISQFEEYKELECNGKTCLIDIGTFAKYYIDQKQISFYSLGEMSNPDFNSMDLKYDPFGFVHIEQYDPERFDNVFYKSDLLTKRTDELKALLSQYKTDVCN